MLKLLLISLLSFSTIIQAAITIEDSRGPQSFKATPQRIASLNWTLSEQLLELDITPLAMTDQAGYEVWVRQPALPAEIEELGSRSEPNLEKLARLKPDLILINEVHNSILPRLEKIAPVLFFKTFSAEHSNPQAAIKVYRQLAQLFGRQQLAETRLKAMQEEFRTLRQQLSEAYSGQLPKVTTVRFANPSSVYIYGNNSMSQYALEQLGISPALPQPNSQWGLVQKRVLELSKIQQGTVLYFEPFAQWPKLAASRLWQAMPFVRKGHIQAVPATWTYGGAMSLKYLAQTLTDSLLKIAPVELSEKKTSGNKKPGNKLSDNKRRVS